MPAVAGSQAPEPDEGARRGGSMIGDSMRAAEGIQRLSERTPAQRLNSIEVQDAGVGINLGNVSPRFDAFFPSRPNGMVWRCRSAARPIEAHGGGTWAPYSIAAADRFYDGLPRFRGK